MIKLLLLDDHPVVSQGLAARYDSMPEFEVVATASTFREALDVASSQSLDIALIDAQLAAMITPAEVATLARHCRVVVFSGRSGEPCVRELVNAGASAIVDKASPFTTLDAVLVDVHAGRNPLPSLSSPVPTTTKALLSAREYEVYLALAKCHVPKEVAGDLGIAKSTVYCHIENIRRKLGVSTLQEIVALAYSEGRGR